MFAVGLASFRQLYQRKGILRDSFELSPVSRQFVVDHLLSLKVGKSTGLDGIGVRFLRDGALRLAGPLCHVINLLIMKIVFIT